MSSTRLANARQVALDVSQKHRHTTLTEALCNSLESDCLPGTGCPRYDSVAIGHLRQEVVFVRIAFSD